MSLRQLHKACLIHDVRPQQFVRCFSKRSTRAPRGDKSVLGASFGALFVFGTALYYRQSQTQMLHCEAKTIGDVSPMTARKEPMRQRMRHFVLDLQSRIIEALEEIEPTATVRRDAWTRSQGGSGVSCVIQDGSVIEKAGVGVSIVHGQLPPQAIKQMSSDHKSIPYDHSSGLSLPFTAQGISLIIHPVNPFAPTVHLNYRYFELYPHGTDPSDPGETEPLTAWFGGGTDLTPSYLNESDARHFHRTLKTVCDGHSTAFFPRFKAWCDAYFSIKHRQEARGVGGIFFDDLTPQNTELSWDGLFSFVTECGESFMTSYLPLLRAHQHDAFDDRQKRWQAMRRGRYVEFNLVHDRGTKFGLATRPFLSRILFVETADFEGEAGARIESILMSLPLHARWEYTSDMGGHGSAEGELLDVLRHPRDWV